MTKGIKGLHRLDDGWWEDKALEGPHSIVLIPFPGGGGACQLVSRVVLANQTEESEVRELSGKESRTGSGTQFGL